MKKLLKGLMAIALVFSSMFVATACGKDDDTGNQEEEENVIAYEDITDFTVGEYSEAGRSNVAIIKNYTGNATEVNIPSKYKKDGKIYTITWLGSETFKDNDTITKVTIPSTIETLGDRIFQDCDSLESVVISKNVTGIDDYTFEGCHSLTSVIFEEGSVLKGIDGRAFAECFHLTSIVLPSSVTSIGTSAFFNSGLTTITIPASVNLIKDSAFFSCEELETVNYAGSATDWEEIDIGNSNDDLTNATIIFSGLD